MTKPEANAERSEKSTVKKIALSWIVVVFVAYFVMASFQKYAIYPIEAKLLPLYSQYASLIFIPHAVRVLATAIYGPKTFLVLLPAMVLEIYPLLITINFIVSPSFILNGSCIKRMESFAST